MTPSNLVDHMFSSLPITWTKDMRVLEPSMGEGVFVFAVIDKLLEFHKGPQEAAVRRILRENVYGVELDATLFQTFSRAFYGRYGVHLDDCEHNFTHQDFFTYSPDVSFDLIVGNPPFGGTFDARIEDDLDRAYGVRDGYKIKKETYAFFTVACTEMLTERGQLAFILSDTFLTINTMQGLRRFLTSSGTVQVVTLESFSAETDYGMVLLHLDRATRSDAITLDAASIDLETIATTGNYSWGIDADTARFFTGPTVGDYLSCSSGMTIGKNELFVRTIASDGSITEPYEFGFTQQPVTLAAELAKARLGKISTAKQQEIRDAEARGDTYKALQVTERTEPLTIQLPHADYAYYNKACSSSFYADPSTVVYWKNDGEAVYTFKKTGPWYLHGVGGKPFFKKEGLTWNLVSASIKARYLPSGYILDSGAPVGVLRENVAHEELWFVLGWLNTKAATSILKSVINHTKNIQGKDIERMPYPFWVAAARKKTAAALVRRTVKDLQAGTIESVPASTIRKLEKLYAYPNEAA